MISNVSKLISILMLLALALSSVEGFCGDSGIRQGETSIHCCDHGKHDTRPSLPCTDIDECDSCANCPCHAPFAITPSLPAYAPTIVVRKPFDISKTLPEVYIPKFIPPQNA